MTIEDMSSGKSGGTDIIETIGGGWRGRGI
jgi:hypothetical protein